MVGEHNKQVLMADGSSSDEEDDDDGLRDLFPADDPEDLGDLATTIRDEVVEKAFKTLSADAVRADGELLRQDVNRVYFRRELSIAECIEVEKLITAAKFRIVDDREEANRSEDDSIKARKRPNRYLTDEEERSLGRQIQLAIQLPQDTSNLEKNYVDRIRKDAQKARDLFVATNIRYVEQIARRMRQPQHLTLEDVMQEGVIGLLRAADLYNPELGFRFKTYATWWIEQRIRRAIADSDRMVRIPVHMQEKLSRIGQAKRKMTLVQGQSPTHQELSHAVGIDPDRLMKLFWLVQITDCVEGDKPIGEDATLLSIIADSGESAYDAVLHKELQDRFRTVLAMLTPKEERILRMRFGIDMDSEHTLASVGDKYDLTRERIRQIEEKALQKLQHPKRSTALKDFLDS